MPVPTATAVAAPRRPLGRVLQLVEPGDDGVEDDGGAVDDREFVVPGRQASPLLQPTEAALDDVALFVVDRVVGDGSAAAESAPLSVSLLVAGFRDHCLDAATAQMGSDGSG